MTRVPVELPYSSASYPYFSLLQLLLGSPLFQCCGACWRHDGDCPSGRWSSRRLSLYERGFYDVQQVWAISAVRIEYSCWCDRPLNLRSLLPNAANRRLQCGVDLCWCGVLFSADCGGEWSGMLIGGFFEEGAAPGYKPEGQGDDQRSAAAAAGDDDGDGVKHGRMVCEVTSGPSHHLRSHRPEVARSPPRGFGRGVFHCSVSDVPGAGLCGLMPGGT